MHKTLSFLSPIFLYIFSCPYATPTLAEVDARSLFFLAQVTPDNTLDTQVNSNGNVSEITGGQTQGDNLFHSFQDFSVSTGNTAFLNNADNISNIFSRVTGDNISTIDGLIRANGSASLFLINPNGIIFGEGAQLDIGGSFLGSTASSILFDDGEFSATKNLDSPPLLTINAPIGLGLEENPAKIVNRSIAQDNEGNPIGLEVALGNNLSLVGGNIKFEGGNATASGGNVELGGLSTAGTINIAEDGSLSFPSDIALADITFNNNAVVDVTGAGGGNIAVNARNLDLRVNSFLDAGINRDSTSDNAQAGDIVINLIDNLTLDNSRIRNLVGGGVGNSGRINIKTGSLSAINGGRISSSTFIGQGNAGGIEIDATGDISFKGIGVGNNNIVDPSGVFSLVVAGAEGDGGDIKISATNLTLEDGGEVNASTGGIGNGGNIDLIISDSISINTGTIEGDTLNLSNSRNGILTRVIQGGVGNAGNVNVTTNNLSITNGATIGTGTFGQGNAGSVNITASEIRFEGANSRSEPSSVGSRVEPGAVGNAGNVNISTDNFTLINKGQINAGVVGQGDGGDINITATKDINITSGELTSGIFSDVSSGAEGNAGNITLTTGNLSLTNGGQITGNTFGQGNAGLVEITALDTISIDGESANGSGSLISSRVESEAIGNAEGVKINTDSLTVTNGSYLDGSTFGQGNAGSIEITANDITFDGENSTGFPSSAFSQVNPGGEGNAGGVTIDTNSLTLNDGGLVSANTFGQGNAGLVEITASDTVSIDGERSNGLSSRVSSQVDGQAEGDAGGIIISSGNDLTLTNGGQILANTFGQGDAGDVTITNDNNLTLNGGQILANTSGRGDAGDVTITTAGNITVTSESFYSAINNRVNADAVGNAGILTISTNNLNLIDGGQILTGTSGQGNAGNANINATGNVTFDGTDSRGEPSGVFSLVNSEAVGNAGNVTIGVNDSLNLTNEGQILANTFGQGNAGDVSVLTDRLNIINGGKIEATNVDSADDSTPAGTGQPGNITIKANLIDLANQATINAETQAETGESGIINLQVAEDITLQDSSLISAQALENANGGNLTIDARFIIADPNSNSDILASAEQGQGGNISIDANSLFGIEERPLNDLTNDINASSEFGLSGTVEIDILEVDPSQNSLDIPFEPVQTELSQTCEGNISASQNKSEFVVTGRGGLPPEPEDNFRLPTISITEDALESNSPTQPVKDSSIIVEATTWVYNAQGKILLLASPSTASSLNFQSNQAKCNS